MKLSCHWTIFLVSIVLFTLLIACNSKQTTVNEQPPSADTTKNLLTFRNDVNFLKNYINTIVLQDEAGQGKIAVSAALQGRVMTSTSDGDDGISYGWINKDAFTSGDTSEHMNAYGGEDRIWLGPEGGQFSIYFSKGKEFNLDNWHVPRFIDIEPFDVVSTSKTEAIFAKEAQLTNYSGTVFNIRIKRTIKLVSKDDALKRLGLNADTQASMVAYESINELMNNGNQPWKKETGLLSIWILGMFNPSPAATIIIPYQGEETELRRFVNDSYFGTVPDDRLKLDGRTIFFKADGKYRSKIGMSPEHAPEWLGSYDGDKGVLTVVKYSKPADVKDYVNSLWEIQKEPYNGDALNAYNDGPPAPGAKPLGPFYELETSSPAAALAPGKTITHVHATFHFKGTPTQLDPIVRHLFGVTTEKVMAVF
jgi:hypothetical protein